MIIDLLIQNKEFFGIIVTFLTVIIPSVILLLSKNEEQKLINYKKFHELIVELSNQDKAKKIGLDQQIAIIYELINFPDHYPVIKRILFDLKINWEGKKKNDPKYDRLIREADKTMEYINKNFISRFFIKIKDQFF